MGVKAAAGLPQFLVTGKAEFSIRPFHRPHPFPLHPVTLSAVAISKGGMGHRAKKPLVPGMWVMAGYAVRAVQSGHCMDGGQLLVFVTAKAESPRVNEEKRSISAAMSPVTVQTSLPGRGVKDLS